MIHIIIVTEVFAVLKFVVLKTMFCFASSEIDMLRIVSILFKLSMVVDYEVAQIKAALKDAGDTYRYGH